MTNTNQKQDGIEERASAMIDKPFGVRSMESLMADFARAETAKLTAERDRLKEALRELCEAADQTAKDSLYVFQHAQDYFGLYEGRQYGEELAKAKALLSEE